MRSAPGLLARTARARLTPSAEVLGGRASSEATPGNTVVHRVVRGGHPVAHPSQQRGPGAVTGTPLLRSWGNRDAVLARCRAFGAAVGALHSHPGVDAAPEAPRPWVLTPDRLPQSTGAGVMGTVHEALADPDIRAVLGDLRSRWTPRTWIHGRLGPASVLVAEAGHAAEPEVVLADLELAGAGEPGWDLAIALDTLAVAADSWSVPAGDAFAAFGSAYQAAGGPARPDAAWRCAQALTSAWRVAVRATASTTSVSSVDGHPPGEGSAADTAWTDAVHPDAQVAALLAQAHIAARRAACIGQSTGGDPG